jgi:hypothetical protein
LAVLIALPGAALGQSSFFDDLIGARGHHTVHRSASKARPKATKPATTAPADKASAPTPQTPPVPLPRPRPTKPATETPPPPAPRPEQKSASPPATTTETPAAEPPKPAEAPAPAQSQPAAGEAAPTAEGESTTPSPPRIYQTACPAVIAGLVEAKALPPINDGNCQEQSPLSVTKIEVNGRMLPLSAPATFNCEMASALPGWVAEVDRYIETMQKTRIKSITVGGSYECRPRNTPDHDTNLSEHGRADALDFVGFTLEDGRTLTVSTDYASSDPGINRLMHFAHDAACTSFTTVLGPDANSLHHDHFHLDLGCHGKTCTYRLCE